MRLWRSGAERSPRVGRTQFWKGVGGGALIVALAAAATAAASLLEIETANPFRHPRLPHIKTKEITVPKPGHAQTILVLGSDHRWQDHGAPARSDTILLVRLDPHQPATTMLSIPRDLQVDIPGAGWNKINAAYAIGGPDLTLKTIKALTGLEINHVINVQFNGSDTALGSTPSLIALLKLGLFSAGHPVRQLQMSTTYASTAEIQSVVHDFLYPPADHPGSSSTQTTSTTSTTSTTQTTSTTSTTTTTTKPPKLTAAQERAQRLAGLFMDDVRPSVAALLGTAEPGAISTLAFPLYTPTSAPRSVSFSLDPGQEALRIYTLRDRADQPHEAYRIVGTLSTGGDQFFGVQGTDWRTPPLLQGTHTTRTVHGRRLDLYRDGSRLSVVAWRTPAAVYWVSNTLSLKLTNAQMLEIASTLAPHTNS